jgi:ATP-dependent Clp protease ATP-binding subunit ClpC
MFERFTEKARRVIFFARYEASAFGSQEITPEHLLLGFLRENASTANQYFRSPAAPESIRSKLAEQLPRGEKIATSVDIPLSQDARRVLAHAIEMSAQSGHKEVVPAHLLIGLLRLETGLAATILREHGVTVETLSESLKQAAPTGKSKPTVPPPSIIGDACHDLTALAAENALPALIGRERELQTIMQVLGRRSGNNPVLIGEPGVGKTAIVLGLAQRIAGQNAPEFLREKRILSLLLDRFGAFPGTRHQFELRFSAFIEELAREGDIILFIDGLFDPVAPTASPFSAVLGQLLPVLPFNQCIATGTPAGYEAASKRDPAIERHFRAITIAPPDESETLQILARLKNEFERYHGVVYEPTTIEIAVRACVQFMPRFPLPGNAAGLLDEAGARVKLRLEKQRPADVSLRTVTTADIEAIVVEMTGISIETIRQRLAKK